MLQDLLRRCIASGQVSADQLVAHHQAGDLLEVDGPTTATPGPFDRYPDERARLTQAIKALAAS